MALAMLREWESIGRPLHELYHIDVYGQWGDCGGRALDHIRGASSLEIPYILDGQLQTRLQGFRCDAGGMGREHHVFQTRQRMTWWQRLDFKNIQPSAGDALSAQRFDQGCLIQDRTAGCV